MESLETTPEFEALLEYLKRERDCDLTGYKRSTLLRRFRSRLRSISIDTYPSYLQYLQQHPEESIALLDEVLINFTGFFRDRETWDYLAGEIIPHILASKRPDEPIRVWSAGCATGEEIYSLLILLAEALGSEACIERVHGYATDVDTVALDLARAGVYSDRDTADIPADLRAKYFKPSERGYVFDEGLRRAIVFGRHDLTRDAPMPRIDLLVCRNALIYFNEEIQRSIFVRFHHALARSGFLFLGKSELVIHRGQIFLPVNLKHRIYRKGVKLELEDQLAIFPKSRTDGEIDRSVVQDHFWKTAFETVPIAQLAIDRDGRLVGANERANHLFGLTPDDRDRPFPELEPGKLIGSCVTFQPFYRARRPMTLRDIEWQDRENTRYFDITIAPVFNARQQLLGITVAFLDKC